MKLNSIKTQLILFLTVFAFYLYIADKDVMFLLSTVVSVVSAVVLDSVIIYLKEKKFFITESSVITGLIIGYVLYSQQSLWIFLLASLLAIGSKYFIAVNKKHLFNPAALGIFVSILLFHATTQWKGTYLWYILVPVGVYFVYKIRKIEIIAGYFLAFLVLFGTQAFIQRINFFNIFGYLSYFYVFIMVIEPKTTPIRPPVKFMFGMCLCILIFILTETGARFDVELCSLLVLNAAVPLLDKLTRKKGA